MVAPHTSHVLRRALRLRCPRCGEGLLFCGLVQMHDACGHCGLSFRREPGFYLGSIYLNYGATVIVTGLLYAALVLGAGASNEAALGICLAVAVLLPVLLFRHARSLLLALDSSVNSRQAGPSAKRRKAWHLRDARCTRPGNFGRSAATMPGPAA